MDSESISNLIQAQKNLTTYSMNSNQQVFTYSKPSTRAKKMQKTKVEKRQKNMWEMPETKRFLRFLEKNKQRLELGRQEKSKIKINYLMSEAVKSRSPAQCHSHMQKMLLKYGTIDNILQAHQELLKKRAYNKTQIDADKKSYVQEKFEPLEVKEVDPLDRFDEVRSLCDGIVERCEWEIFMESIDIFEQRRNQCDFYFDFE